MPCIHQNKFLFPEKIINFAFQIVKNYKQLNFFIKN